MYFIHDHTGSGNKLWWENFRAVTHNLIFSLMFEDCKSLRNCTKSIIYLSSFVAVQIFLLLLPFKPIHANLLIHQEEPYGRKMYIQEYTIEKCTFAKRIIQTFKARIIYLSSFVAVLIFLFLLYLSKQFMLTFWSIKVSLCVTTSSRGRKADYIDVISTNTLDVAYKSTHILRRY